MINHLDLTWLKATDRRVFLESAWFPGYFQIIIIIYLFVYESNLRPHHIITPNV